MTEVGTMPVVDRDHDGTTVDLQQALERATAGHDDGFTALYRAVHPRLLRYLATLVGAEAEDVAAETWYQVARDLRRFTGDVDGFRGWVSTIGRHRALDHLRAAGRRPVIAEDLTGLDRPAADDTAQQAVDGLGLAEALQIVAELPREMAEAVMLRAVMGLDVARTAEVLGKRPGTVRVAAHRGLKRLAASWRRVEHERAPATPAPAAGATEEKAARARTPRVGPQKSTRAAPAKAGRVTPPTDTTLEGLS